MNPITQQFMMGAAGGKTSYWITNILTAAGSGSNYPTYNSQSIRVDSASNVIFSITYGGNAITLAKMSDLGVLSWSTSYQGDAGTNYNFGASFGQLVACSDGSFVLSGQLYDFVNSRQAGFLTFSSSGAFQSQRNIYGSTFGSGTYTTSTQQLPNGNLATVPRGGYGTLVELNSSATSVVTTRNAYKASSTASTSPLNNRAGEPYYILKIYNNTAYIFDAQITIGSDNVMALYVLNSNGSASSTSYTYKQPGYSVDYFISNKNFAVTSSGVYMVYNSGQFDSNSYFLFSYSSFSSGVQYTKIISAASPNGVIPMVEVDAQGNAYLIYLFDSYTVYVFKYNTTGTVVWKRKLAISSGGLSSFGGAVVTSTALYLYMSATIAKLPLDGTLTGTYGPYTWTSITDTHSDSYTLSQTTNSSASSGTTTNPSFSTPGTIALTRSVTPTQYLMA